MLPLFGEKGVELASAVSGDVASVLADNDRVVQVLTNLLGNALRHTPAGGLVTVEAEVQEDTVAFRVKDTGEGIAPEHLPRVLAVLQGGEVPLAGEWRFRGGTRDLPSARRSDGRENPSRKLRPGQGCDLDLHAADLPLKILIQS